MICYLNLTTNDFSVLIHKTRSVKLDAFLTPVPFPRVLVKVFYSYSIPIADDLTEGLDAKQHYPTTK